MLNRERLQTVLLCDNCGSDARIGASSWTCSRCGAEEQIRQGSIVVSNSPDREDNGGDLSYIQDTRDRYRSFDYANEYLSRYSDPTQLGKWYSAIVAQRERVCIRKALGLTRGVLTVLDIPAGTGKLASVHNMFDYDVVAGDVSLEMLEVGLRTEWRGCENLVGMIQADVTDMQLRNGAVDCAICLRLMHRLPDQVLRAALGELTRVARKWLIVSNDVNRRSLAYCIRRGREGRASHDRREWRLILSGYGQVVEEFNVLPAISTETVSLVRVG